MQLATAGLQNRELAVYLDNVLVFSETLEDPEGRFNRLMKRLTEANLAIGLKCVSS